MEKHMILQLMFEGQTDLCIVNDHQTGGAVIVRKKTD